MLAPILLRGLGGGRDVAIAIVGLAALVVASGGSPVIADDLQVGVLRDGFLVIRTIDGGRRLLELDRQGQQRRAHTVDRTGDIRAVGASGGPLLAWQDGRNLILSTPDGRHQTTWGKSMRQLCDGVASNDSRFAVGWLEADDTVWFVHGPVAKSQTADDSDTAAVLAAPADLARNEWCGITSAEQNISLLWRTGDKLSLVMCTKKRCGSLPGNFKLARDRPILGFGCLRDACLIATRDTAGQPQLHYITSSGRRKWSASLPATSATISIIGYASRAFAVGYATSDGATITRFDTTGATSSLWSEPGVTGAPELAWSAGQLLVSHRHGSGVDNDLVSAPQ